MMLMPKWNGIENINWNIKIWKYENGIGINKNVMRIIGYRIS